MTIRKKLLILLLSISLIPLVSYFVFNISFSRIARNRVQRTLRSTVEDRATDSLVQTVKNYEDRLKLSRQAVRFGVRHYADQVQQSLWSISVGREGPASGRLTVRQPLDEISTEAEEKYKFVSPSGNKEQAVDFESQLVRSGQGASENPLESKSAQLARTCKNIYTINPESTLWIYTVLADGSVALYPSLSSWPYGQEYDLRQEPWYINAESRNQPIPTPRIEPLTGKTVMTVAIPLFEQNNSFAGVVAMDIDLSGMLDRMEIPEQWQKGAWKLLIRLPRRQELEAGGAEVVCCAKFLDSQEGPAGPSRLLDVCSPENGAKMIADSRRGNVGFIRQPYDGVDSVWVYGSSERGGAFPILVVPYKRITEQAENAQQILLQDNIRAMQAATILIFVVIVAAVVLAVMRARNVTVPITHLADAAGRLAQGDFGVKVNITTKDELQWLGDVFNQVGPRLQERQKIKQSLELARQIQQHFLPRRNPELDNFELAAICRYCDETGGDYYDLFDLRSATPGRIGLVIGDVSGHGIPAAMLMISAGSILRNNAPLHGDDLSAAISELNAHLVKNSESGKFMTLFYGLLNDDSRTLLWTSAGHDPAIWYQAQSAEITELQNTGMPLGIMDDAQFGREGPVALTAGDIVLVGTDGIWEARNPDEKMYGKERLIDLIGEHKDESAEKIASSVVQSVLDFCFGAPQTDDITLLVIKCVR